MSETTIRNVLNHTVRHVHTSTLHHLARALKTSPADLMGQVGPELPADVRLLVELIQATLTPLERRTLIAFLRAKGAADKPPRKRSRPTPNPSGVQ